MNYMSVCSKCKKFRKIAGMVDVKKEDTGGTIKLIGHFEICKDCLKEIEELLE